MVRKGMGTGQGKGYKNMIGVDSRVHSMSSKGIKQPQRISPFLNFKSELISEMSLKDLKQTKKLAEEGIKQFKDFPEIVQRQKETLELINRKLNTPDFVKNKTLTEEQINLLKRRLNDKKIKPQDIFSDSEDGFRLSEEQQKKGLKYLNNLWKSPKTGVERKNNPFGYREEEVLNNVDYIELIDFYDNSNYYQSQMGMKNYQPYYRVVSKPEKDGSRNTFEYYVGYSSDNPKSPIQILG